MRSTSLQPKKNNNSNQFESESLENTHISCFNNSDYTHLNIVTGFWNYDLESVTISFNFFF